MSCIGKCDKEVLRSISNDFIESDTISSMGSYFVCEILIPDEF